MIISIYIGNSYNSLSFLFFSSIYIVLCFHESNRFRIEIETKSKDEIELMRQIVETERKESENAAEELRYMIANVAHDLKTVSSSSFISLLLISFV